MRFTSRVKRTTQASSAGGHFVGFRRFQPVSQAPFRGGGRSVDHRLPDDEQHTAGKARRRVRPRHTRGAIAPPCWPLPLHALQHDELIGLGVAQSSSTLPAERSEGCGASDLHMYFLRIEIKSTFKWYFFSSLPSPLVHVLEHLSCVPDYNAVYFGNHAQGSGLLASADACVGTRKSFPPPCFSTIVSTAHHIW